MGLFYDSAQGVWVSLKNTDDCVQHKETYLEKEKLEIPLLQSLPQQLQHNPELHPDLQHCGFVLLTQVKFWVCFHQI